MNTGQQVTFGLALSLVLVSLWKGGDVQAIWTTISTNSGGDQLKPEMLALGTDTLFLIVIIWLAALGPDAAKMTGALCVALWLAFLLHGSREQAGATKSSFVVGNPTTWISV
jgi:hypothetical protein